jgi:cytochrome P450 family 9
MSFMGYELAVNPEVQEKLFEEIQESERELNGKKLSYEKLQSLKYLDQVVSEVLRKWPPAPGTDRICVKDYVLEYDDRRVVIEKGINLMIPVRAIHHDPEFFPNPEKFDPERFSNENKGSIREFTYLPFGVGPRNCIGSRFALMEVKAIFYYLLINFKINVSAKTQIPLQFAKSPVGLKTEKGIWLNLDPR